MRKMTHDQIIALMMDNQNRTNFARAQAPNPTPAPAPVVAPTVTVSPMGGSAIFGSLRHDQTNAEALSFQEAIRGTHESLYPWAIALFTGTYSKGEPLGSQLDAAKRQAAKILRPVTPREYTRSGKVSMDAVIHAGSKGVDPTRKDITHLIGTRRRLVAEMVKAEALGFSTDIVEAQIQEVNRQLDQYGCR